MKKTSLTKLDRSFKPDINYWELNPQVAYIEPFDRIYAVDDGGEASSKTMWAIFFMCDPDEEENLLYRLKINDRKKAVEKYFPNIDWDNELLKEGLKEYPYQCLNTVQRALKSELDTLKDREELIRETERTMDDYMRHPDGSYILDKQNKPIWIKGNAAQLDKMHGQTSKLYENIEKVIEKFMFQKAEDARIYGGRKPTIAEKGLL